MSLVLLFWVASAELLGQTSTISTPNSNIVVQTDSLSADYVTKSGVLLPQPGSKFVFEYYDKEKRQLKRIYEVKKSNPNEPEGRYFSFYQTNRLKDRGYYKAGKPSGNWQHYLQNGNLSGRGSYQNGIQHGQWAFYFEGGSPKSAGEMNLGKPQGHWRFYFESGTIKQEGDYLNGKPVGYWTYYFENTCQKAVAHYAGDTAYYKERYEEGALKSEGKLLDGQSIGQWKYYYASGKLKAVGTELKGVKDGYWRYYYENDSLESEGAYVQGVQTGNWKYYHKNGRLNTSGQIVSGQKEGKWALYYETGELAGNATFQNGDGDYTAYYPSGKLKTTGKMQKGQNHGDWTYYAEDGTVEGRAHFFEGNGEYIGYYQDGKKRVQGQLQNNERVGSWQLFDKAGVLVGYYKAFTQNEIIPLPPVANRPPEKPKETARMVKISKGWRHFRKVINEPEGWIVGINPIAFLFGTLPVSLEYHWKPRLGYELTGALIRNRFLADYSAPEANLTYSQGFYLSAKQKLYFDEDPTIGSFYWAQELRYTSLSHEHNQINFSDSLSVRQGPLTLATSEQRIDLSVLVGTRLFQARGKKQDITLDVFVGAGFGLRFLNDTRNNGVQSGLDRSVTPVNFRLGFMVGYMGRK